MSDDLIKEQAEHLYDHTMKSFRGAGKIQDAFERQKVSALKLIEDGLRKSTATAVTDFLTSAISLDLEYQGGTMPFIGDIFTFHRDSQKAGAKAGDAKFRAAARNAEEQQLFEGFVIDDQTGESKSIGINPNSPDLGPKPRRPSYAGKYDEAYATQLKILNDHQLMGDQEGVASTMRTLQIMEAAMLVDGVQHPLAHLQGETPTQPAPAAPVAPLKAATDERV